MEKMTAKNFEQPLLLAMTNVTNGDLDVGVKISDIYQQTCDLAGVPDIHAHGNMAGEQPRVARWIQWAAKNLRDASLLRAEAGKLWYVTPQGVEHSKTLAALKTTKSHTQALNDSIIEAIIELPPQAAEVFMKAPLPDVLPAPYHTDPHIVRVAILATPCFGNYGGEKICHTCPLAVPCHRETKAPTPTPAPAQAEAPPAVNPSETGAGKVRHRTFVVPASMTCTACGQTIEAGTRAAWLDNRAALHLGCLQPA